MAYVLSSISGNLISAASAGFAPTNSADVSAIASAYQVVSSTATQLYAGTAYVTSVNEAPISAARAGNAANASLANSAYYDGTGRLISALPDSAAVSAIASSYVESGVSSKQDTLSFAYNTADQISSINGSALGGMDEAAVSGIASAYAESAVSSKADESALSGYYTTANESGFITGVDLSDYATTAYVDSSISSFVDSAYVESAVSGKADSSALSSYALSADVSGTVDLVSTQSANWGGSALALSAGPGVSLTLSGNTLVASTDETVLWENAAGATNNITLSEAIENFDTVRVEWCPYTEASNWATPYDVVEGKVSNGLLHLCGWGLSNDTNYQVQTNLLLACSTTSVTVSNQGAILVSTADAKTQTLSGYKIYRIIGINRTAEA